MQIWLYYAVQMEWFGNNTFYEMQYTNYGYFVANILSIVMILREHKMTITFEMDGEYQVSNMYNQLMGVMKDSKKVNEKAKDKKWFSDLVK